MGKTPEPGTERLDPTPPFPFMEDPDPAMRVFSDLAYIGTLGILGDAVDAALASSLAAGGLDPRSFFPIEVAPTLAVSGPCQ